MQRHWGRSTFDIEEQEAEMDGAERASGKVMRGEVGEPGGAGRQ